MPPTFVFVTDMEDSARGVGTLGWAADSAEEEGAGGESVSLGGLYPAAIDRRVLRSSLFRRAYVPIHRSSVADRRTHGRCGDTIHSFTPSIISIVSHMDSESERSERQSRAQRGFVSLCGMEWSGVEWGGVGWSRVEWSGVWGITGDVGCEDVAAR